MPIYRGYDIDTNEDDLWDVKTDGKIVHVATTELKAYDWVDAQIRKRNKKE